MGFKNRLLFCFALMMCTSSSLAAESEPTELDCIVKPNVVVEVSTAIEGVLKDINVDEGEKVRKGQVLATLESEVQGAALKVARARAEMQAQLDAARVEYASAKRKYERSNELAEEDFISSDEKDELKTKMDLARLRILESEENRRLAAMELARAQALYNMRTIRSPISGVVVEQYLSPGEFAQAQPILRLASIDPLHVEVVAPVRLYGKIHPGMTAQVIPESPLEGIYEAEVEVVDPVVDAASGTFDIRLVLPNPDHTLPAGVECRVRFDAPVE